MKSSSFIQYHRYIVFLVVVWVTVASVSFASEGVSPGALDRLAVIETRCPTFSWQLAGRAVVYYELSAFALPEDGSNAELSAEAEVLYAQVSGGASSWTPSSEQCFASGGSYGWQIRAVYEETGGDGVDASEWSEWLYFIIPKAPSVEDVAQALELLERYIAQGGDTGALRPANSGGRLAGIGFKAPKSVSSAAAAIRGEHPSTSGQVYGVIGSSASPAGAGLAAANTGGGPDLVLDGSANGAVDALLKESGLDRPSATDQTFTFFNSGAGGLNVHVGGRLSGNSLEVDEVRVPFGLVIDDEGQWQGVGDTIPCAGCVASADLATGAVSSSKIADGAVGPTAIRPNAVEGTHITNGAVTALKLADDAVTSAKIADGAVGGTHIVDGGVSTTKLASGAVTTNKLAVGAVNAAVILDENVLTQDLADSAVTTAKIANGAVTGAKITTGAVASATILEAEAAQVISLQG